MKVCWLSNYFSPYKLKLFEELNKKVELTAVLLEGKDDIHRNGEWTLKDDHSFNVHIIDKNYNKLIKKLAKENDVLIDSMYSTKYGILAVNAFKNEHKITMMYADGGVPIDRGIINHVISYFMKRHDYYFSSGPHCDRYYEFYNVDLSKRFYYHFSSLLSKDIIENRNLRLMKNELRNELGIDNKFTIISVGKPVKGKGFDVLLDAYIKTGETDSINLFIIGGTPQDEIKEIVEKNKLSNVHFVGLIDSQELKKYYASGDMFMLCTRTDVWGLVIIEAMSFGLPVLTSNNCGAGVHFNMLGDNVMICDVEDSNEYSKKILDLFSDNKLVNEYSQMSLENVNDYIIENGAQDIYDGLCKALHQ